jgi:hypothetical protein
MQSNRSTLREEIVRWFDDPNQLRQALREGSPSRSFDELVTPSADYGHQVFQLIDRANKDGWLPGLISTLLTVRAGNALFAAKLQPIADRLAAGHSLDPLDAEAMAKAGPRSSHGAAAAGRHASLCVAPWATGQTVRPLPGYPVLKEKDETVLTGGGLVNLVFSHDHASAHGIVITNLVPEWSYRPPDLTAQVKYEIDGAALPPQGFFTPERFTLVLDGSALRNASWTTGQQVRPPDADLLDTDPPRQIQLDAGTADAISLQGVVRLLTPGRYALRWRIGFAVSGEIGELTTAPLHFVQAE